MDSLPNLLAKLFIARTDVKAIQLSNGAYNPVRTPWIRKDIEDHLAGRKTYGHYLLNKQNQCKLFAFDIDFKPQGKYPFPFDHTGWNEANEFLGEIRDFNPRNAWLDRGHPSRDWVKLQLKIIATRLCSGIRKELDTRCAVAYSGHKGIHVYGLMGGELIPARHARMGAQIVLDAVLPDWSPSKGNNFYQCDNPDPVNSFPCFGIEVFPKQDELTGEAGFGNLLRLPLGRNLKNPKDPTFFINMSDALNSFTALDSISALTTDNCFKNIKDKIA